MHNRNRNEKFNNNTLSEWPCVCQGKRQGVSKFKSEIAKVATWTVEETNF